MRAGLANAGASQAQAHLAKLESCDETTCSVYNVRLVIVDELNACAEAYPAMARAARQEGFDEIAAWFELHAKANRSHAGRFRRALETLL